MTNNSDWRDTALGLVIIVALVALCVWGHAVISAAM